MRLKLLLVSLLMTFGVLQAQDTIKSFVISEARIDDAHNCYVELTNVGDAPINLSEFEFGKIGAWTTPWNSAPADAMMLPDVMLGVNESFVIGAFLDWTEEMYLIDPDHYAERVTKPDMWTLADLQIHRAESPGGTGIGDSVSAEQSIVTVWGGRDCWYLEHHLSNGDSAVIDQVNGIFDEGDGTNYAQAYDCAGYTNASNTTVLVRKFSVKTGQLDYVLGRGSDISESEWMPIPLLEASYEPHRKSFWTVGNHGDYNLDETTLTSSLIDVDWDNDVLNVPWGVRTKDSLMMAFDYQEGLAWHYELAAVHEDSAYMSARSGDVITIWACGLDRDERVFSVNLVAPTAEENRVIPKSGKNAIGWYGEFVGQWCDVSEGLAMDTISDVGYATRSDSLLKYLEKAPDANWEFVFNGGVTRPDLIDGDILRVTASNSDVKDYYIKVEEYRPSHNAYLSAITWPDIPEYLKNIYGWTEDTIPDFKNTKYNYKVEVPFEVQGIPALVATTENQNATVEVERATYIYGTPEDRTVKFNTLAEDDSTEYSYSVLFYKQKNPEEAQPYTTGEAFLSQIVCREWWNSTFIELCNPNGAPMDMSDYMVMASGSGATADGYSGVGDSATRYRRYVPGYKWQTPAEWAITPAVMEQDVSGTNPLTQPGDVFVIGVLRDDHWKKDQVDFNFSEPPFDVETEFFFNDWNIHGEDRSIVSIWISHSIYLYKIENAEVKAGTKPANDIADFRLVDVFGNSGGGTWVIGGETMNQNQGFTRRPQYYKGEPLEGVSFGTNDEDAQWDMVNEAYYTALGFGWPDNNTLIADGVGSHFMNDITEHISTVTSRYYNVSTGYSVTETIDGIVTGITADEFFANVAKASEAQVWGIYSGVTSGLELTGADVLTDQDTLIVSSENGNNTTKYILGVSASGLSDDAVLTSTEYTVDATGNPGSVSDFEYGALLKDVVTNVTVPDGATMTVIDAAGAYVPMKVLNLDTVYVDVLATDKVFFEVVAANGITTLLYQLLPNVAVTDAFVLSTSYGVDEDQMLIEFVPDGTTVTTFLNNLIPATGATMVLKDKAGFDRTDGIVVEDDQLIVTAQDGTTTATYNLVFLVPDESFLAYVTSEIYTVDQNNLMITEWLEKINISTETATFIGNLIPAASASLTVMHSDMSENTTGNMVVGDILQVLSGNQLKVQYYDITVGPVSVEQIEAGEILIYPNPSTGIVYINGLEEGMRVVVYNTLGKRISDRFVYDNEETLSLEDQQTGMYFVVVSDDKGTRGQYKIVIH